jgi:hypothetical protein
MRGGRTTLLARGAVQAKRKYIYIYMRVLAIGGGSAIGVAEPLTIFSFSYSFSSLMSQQKDIIQMHIQYVQKTSYTILVHNVCVCACHSVRH